MLSPTRLHRELRGIDLHGHARERCNNILIYPPFLGKCGIIIGQKPGAKSCTESENCRQFSDRTASELPALGHTSPREGGRDKNFATKTDESASLSPSSHSALQDRKRAKGGAITRIKTDRSLSQNAKRCWRS